MESSSGSGASPKLVHSLLERVNRIVDELCRDREGINLMEVCGTHTMAISGFGIRQAVDKRLKLLSGPGCPVCVTTQEEIDGAIGLAENPDITLVTFGDMMRVPGSRCSLEQEKAKGADVRVIYSAMDALDFADAENGRQFVFLGIGFETTAPTVAAAVLAAQHRGIENLSVLPMFKLIPPALEKIVSSKRVNISGFILPGHVSTIIGTRKYQFLVEKYRMPSCITGFEASDIVQGIYMLLKQMKEGPEVAIQYRRIVRPEGNPEARHIMETVFEPVDAAWRGIGMMPGSGLGFREDFGLFDAHKRFEFKPRKPRKTGCRCGEVMLGLITPPECKLFGKICTPEMPVGPCMVSSEGACAAYYKYERRND
ncbi:hydrogenase formation protein HypD [candidate division WOR-3 bacterium JGI_Cruoil_03_51_56]|uniref:Hydrogenase formation protein HypD n=1 Tax=candidate division WOR-3 bacterium JGI_Cruoil_03_51_56 TaxID=1973747 RepID=A0A235BT87_UNCW3|nr:MAG: hydrogenase formation protein HypD [candidate division WOR-3 bacterium JGI_Cruoil_03_51_56]